MFNATLSKLRRLLAPTVVQPGENALVLSGGGARASFQVGVLQYIAEFFPQASFPILAGVSAGAINAAHLANYVGTFREATEHLYDHWNTITVEDVFRQESTLALFRRIMGQSVDKRHPSDIVLRVEEGQALVDTAPLRAFLERKLHTAHGELTGIAHNIESGRLKAISITTTNYQTGQTVTWVQGSDILHWQRPNRVGFQTRLTLDHIMASTALPLLFPAVQIDHAWYGDGGIRLSAPLSPAVHLGADQILVISTRYQRTQHEADTPVVRGYPPAAQVIGLLMNAIFLDVLDQDALMMERINKLLETLPPHKWGEFRPIKLLVIRPTHDLARLSTEYEVKLKGALRLLTRGLGTGETESPDWLSMLLFENDYVVRLMELGWEDARRQHDQIEMFLDTQYRTMPSNDIHA